MRGARVGGLEEGTFDVSYTVGRSFSVSFSGGGVGGNTLRCIGGSDCCLERLCRFGLTRFEAAKEMDSGGRS